MPARRPLVHAPSLVLLALIANGCASNPTPRCRAQSDCGATMECYSGFCIPGATANDTGGSDGSPSDGGPTDGGPTDGGPTDVGPIDGGPCSEDRIYCDGDCVDPRDRHHCGACDVDCGDENCVALVCEVPG